MRLAKALVGFNLTIEIGEIYGDVWGIGKSLERKEKLLLECADSFIPCSRTLSEKLRPRSKIILHGDYRIKSN